MKELTLSAAIAKLNQEVISVDKAYKPSVEFYIGEAVGLEAELAQKICPLGTVALLHTGKSFARYSTKLKTALTQKGFTVCEATMSEKDVFSLSKLAELFTLPEEVRLIICTDVTLTQAVAYFATIKNLPFSVVIDSYRIDGCNPYKAKVFNGKRLESVTVTARRFIVIDSEYLNKDTRTVPELFAYCQSKLTALIDYKLFCEVKGSAFNEHFNEVISNAVSDSLGVYKYKMSEHLSRLLLCAFKIELANYYSFGKFFDNFSSRIAQTIYNGNAFSCAGEEYMLSIKIMQMYSMCFSGKYSDILEIPDYNERAEELAKITGWHSVTIGWLRKSVEEYNANVKKISSLKKKLYGNVKSLCGFYEKSYKTYIALGGKEYKINEKMLNAVKLSGDVYGVFNGMTILRESGITELL